MAYIPYGYRIERGRAVIDEEAAGKLKEFIGLYLDGLSIKEAVKKAEIPLTRCTAGRILEREVYLGDDYYPPLIDRETFNRIGEEKLRRYEKLGCFGNRGSRDAAPVREKFCVEMPERVMETITRGTPAEKFALLFSCIRPSGTGTRVIGADDKAAMKEWMEKGENTCQ